MLVRFKFSRPSTFGVDIPAAGERLRISLAHREESDGGLRLTDAFRVILDETGAALVPLTPTGLGQGWQIDEQWGDGETYVLAVPADASTADAIDLIHLDRDSLLPSAGNIEAWQAAIAQVESIRALTSALAAEAEASRLGALGYRSDARAARDEARAFRDTAQGWATTANDFRALSATAAAASSSSAVDADAARAGAQAIKDSIAADRGAANGLATLDASGRIPSSQLPLSAMEYRGTWNPSTNTPALSNASGSLGDMYRVSVTAARDLGSGVVEFTAGDYAIHNGTSWEKADTTDSVQSVAGKTGAVTLAKADVGLGNVDNTSDANKPISTATQAALNDTVSGAALSGDALVFSKVGGGQVNVGSVRGPQGIPGDLTPASAGSWNPAWGTLAVNAATELPSTRRVTLLGSVTVGITGTPSATKSGTISLILVQASSGGPFTVTWPSSILWAGGAPGPAMPTAANAELLVHLFWTGTAWRGIVGGVFYA